MARHVCSLCNVGVQCIHAVWQYTARWTEQVRQMTDRFQADRIDALRCADGVDRRVLVWDAPDPRGILIGVHGGLAHAGDFVTPALHFKAQGWTTVSFELRGHSEQKRVHIDRFSDFVLDLDLMVRQVRQWWPGLPVFIMGHSMGGLIGAHFGLQLCRQMNPALELQSQVEDIRGYIFSSPYWANAIAVNPFLKKLSGVLSRCVPTMKAPLQDFTDVLTHDSAITARHRTDEQDNIRASEATIRFGSELLIAQQQLSQSISRWNLPVYVILAGQDKLADTPQVQRYIESMQGDDVTKVVYPENYHENLNEINRDVVYRGVRDWLAARS